MTQFSRLKNNQGFTLVEVMISILALTMLSGFILQMFLLASQVNQKAQDTSYVTTNAINAIEVFKNTKSPFDIENDSIIKGALIERKDDELFITTLYDHSWHVVPVTANDIKAGEIPDEAKFQIDIHISVDTESSVNPNTINLNYSSGLQAAGDAALTGRVFKMEVTGYRLQVDSTKSYLASLDASHYFVY